jgi:hypothetical protein
VGQAVGPHQRLFVSQRARERGELGGGGDAVCFGVREAVGRNWLQLLA